MIEKVISFCDKVFGSDYITKKQCKEYLSLKNSWVLFQGEEIVGVAICFDPDHLHRAYLKIIAVSPEKQRKGIGGKLLSLVIGTAKQQGSKEIIFDCWYNEKHTSSFDFFVSQGATITKIKKEFWKEDSIKRNYNCPACGNPCLCDSIEMKITLK